MGLEAFKQIFFWEWFHRLVGPLDRPGLRPALRLVLDDRAHRPAAAATAGRIASVLGGLQGLLGWFMVKSGLVDRPSVSHYRLAAHLGLAVLIYALLMWQAWIAAGHGGSRQRPARLCDGTCIAAATALVAVTMLWGAFVAGLDAGLAYNTFPLMDGRLLPPEAWNLIPAWAQPAGQYGPGPVHPPLAGDRHRRVWCWLLWFRARTVAAAACAAPAAMAAADRRAAGPRWGSQPCWLQVPVSLGRRPSGGGTAAAHRVALGAYTLPEAHKGPNRPSDRRSSDPSCYRGRVDLIPVAASKARD